MDFINKLSYTLDEFQKKAIESIDNGNHTLITAHTGSGKTLPAEYAINKFVTQGKRVIYTSPIKSLSNQKFNEFSLKFPHISFGLITGDIKCNPDAQCLIMTTEILRNTLFEYKMENKLTNLFEIDLDSDLGCIIFDEIHYINDADRGRVWEESIMLAPQNSLFVMLSATLNNVNLFSGWINKVKNKNVVVCSNDIRVVPLNHYLYFCSPDFSGKLNNTESFTINNFSQMPFQIRSENGSFNERNYHNVRSFLDILSKNNLYVKPAFVLNNVIDFLERNNRLPAILFVFSRKQVVKYAKMIGKSLINNAYEVETICNQLLRKVDDYDNYIKTSEYKQMISLLKKGVGIHHSGLIPIFKEIVEILYSRGLIKLLIATETFSVGINMPTKTVLFSGLQKFSNSGTFRYLLPQEYTQMAGRAGRRGLDDIGYVYHLCNLYERNLPSSNEYRNIVNGNSQTIRSKFKIHNNLILRLISAKVTPSDFVQSSMIKNELTNEISFREKELLKLKNTTNYNFNPVILEYHELFKEYNNCGHSNKTKVFKKMKNIENKEYNIVNEHKKYIKHVTLLQNTADLKKTIDETKNYIDDTIYIILTQLQNDSFIISTDNNNYSLTDLGKTAIHIQEGHSLVISQLFHDKSFRDLDVVDIVSILSVFVPIRGDNVSSIEKYKDSSIYPHISFIKDTLDYYNKKDEQYILDVAEVYVFQIDLCDIISNWCKAESNDECNNLLSEIYTLGVSTGDFVKAVLKINALSNELSGVCELFNFMDFKQKLERISDLTMKHIVTNKSLYI
jgi:superfamily II RNA helicase